MPDISPLVPWLNIAWLILAIGLWRGRREAAEKAALAAVEHVKELFNQRFDTLEYRQREMDAERRRDYERLHTKAGQMQAAIAENFARIQELFVSRAEFDRLDRQVFALEGRVNQHLDNRSTTGA